MNKKLSAVALMVLLIYSLATVTASAESTDWKALQLMIMARTMHSC